MARLLRGGGEGTCRVTLAMKQTDQGSRNGGEGGGDGFQEGNLESLGKSVKCEGRGGGVEVGLPPDISTDGGTWRGVYIACCLGEVCSD